MFSSSHYYSYYCEVAKIFGFTVSGSVCPIWRNNDFRIFLYETSTTCILLRARWRILIKEIWRSDNRLRTYSVCLELSNLLRVGANETVDPDDWVTAACRQEQSTRTERRAQHARTNTRSLNKLHRLCAEKTTWHLSGEVPKATEYERSRGNLLKLLGRLVIVPEADCRVLSSWYKAPYVSLDKWTELQWHSISRNQYTRRCITTVHTHETNMVHRYKPGGRRPSGRARVGHTDRRWFLGTRFVRTCHSCLRRVACSRSSPSGQRSRRRDLAAWPADGRRPRSTPSLACHRLPVILKPGILRREMKASSSKASRD